MTAPVPTLAQTICLVALSRGEQPPWLPVTTRRTLLRERWIAQQNKREPGAKERRLYNLTDAGRAVLAASPHLGAAMRKLDEGKQGRPWQ